jgi:thiol-disulfide isomerase/thioredoxin
MLASSHIGYCEKKVMRPLAVVLTVLVAAGMAAAQITTTDVAGRQVQLFDQSSSKLAVLIFVRTDCPIANRYAPEIEHLYQAYASRVTYYLVYPDANESAVAIQKHLSDYGYTVPALRDPKHVLVKLAKARVTPEAAIFSARGELLYHGRIDNRYISFGKARNRPTHQDLEEALLAALAGLPIKEVVTRAIGCSLADI